MKKLFILCAGLSPLSCAFAEYSSMFIPQYMPPSAVYLTVGGGVAWLENNDFVRYPNAPNLNQVEQPSNADRVTGMVNAALGYQFHTFPVRAEVAYHWYDASHYDWIPLYEGTDNEGNPAGQGKIESQSILFNVYYDFYNRTRFTPFIGAGIGYSSNHSTFTVYSIGNSPSSGKPETNTDNDFAWGASVGVKYEITPNWLVDVRADYTDFSHVELYEFTNMRKGVMKTDNFYSISAMLNLTYAYNFE